MHTDHAGPAVAAYLTRIGSVPLLTAEQETELAAAIEAGREAADRLEHSDLDPGECAGLRDAVTEGDTARAAMVTANLRLVVAQARRFTDRRTTLLDLVQEGNVGLIRAVEKFDHRLGFKFSTYATWWIRQSISEALEQDRPIHLPPKVYRELETCRRAREELQATLRRRPTTAEIATAVGLDEVRVRRLLRSDLQPLSLDHPEYGGWDPPDPAADTAACADRALIVGHVTAVVDRLPALERDVVRMRFGLGQAEHSRTEVARALGLSLSAVRRLERKALGRMRGWESLHRLRAADLP